jgi:hypothetical protein
VSVYLHNAHTVPPQIPPQCKVNIVGLENFNAGSKVCAHTHSFFAREWRVVGVHLLCDGRYQLWLVVHTAESTSPTEIPLRHTMNDSQIAWFKAGSALNHVRAMAAAAKNSKGLPPPPPPQH